MPTLSQPTDLPSASGAIQLKLRDVTQLFNSLDPSPFNEQDLDHDAEEFIVSWAREFPSGQRLRLVVHVEKAFPPHYSAPGIAQAVQNYFAYRASINRLDFRQLLKQGRTTLIIGSCFLVFCLSLSNLVPRDGRGSHPLTDIIRESLTIAGWVAMWRPMEIYLYEWWPLRLRGRLLLRLSEMDVQVRSPVAT